MNSKNGIRNMVFSDFYCEVCNTRIPLSRRKNRQRELGHVKDVYCIKCKEITKHSEVRFKDAPLHFNSKGE